MQAVRVHPHTSQHDPPYSVTNPAPASALFLDTNVPIPELSAPGQVLVRVYASTVTRDELTWPETYAAEYPILGHDVAGVVVSTYDKDSHFKPGDEVYGMVGQHAGCSWAEYAVAEGHELARKPKSLSWAETVTCAMNGLTAWQALFEKAAFPEPDLEAAARSGSTPPISEKRKVLVTGASGMVGTWVVQLAVLAGIHIVAASGSNARNEEFLKSLGASEVVEYGQLKDSSRKFDVIIDTVGGDPQAQSWSWVGDDGIIVTVDSSSFQIAETKPPGKKHVKALFFIVQTTGDQLTKLGPVLESGQVNAFVSEVYPLAKAREAYERASGRLDKRGKVVLQVME